MPTKIFKVDFQYTEKYNDKNPVILNESKNIVAPDCWVALSKVWAKMSNETSFVDSETNKKVKVTRSGFNPINVNLIAESD